MTKKHVKVNMTPERIALLKSFEPKVRPPTTKSTEAAKDAKGTKDTK